MKKIYCKLLVLMLILMVSSTNVFAKEKDKKSQPDEKGTIQIDEDTVLKYEFTYDNSNSNDNTITTSAVSQKSASASGTFKIISSGQEIGIFGLDAAFAYDKDMVTTVSSRAWSQGYFTYKCPSPTPVVENNITSSKVSAMYILTTNTGEFVKMAQIWIACDKSGVITYKIY